MPTTIEEGLTRKEFLRRAAALALLLAGPAAAEAGDPGNFRRVYGDPVLRERFFPFLRNVFRLYPEEEFHALIADLSKTHSADREVYELLLQRIPEIKPALSELNYALPALKKQKAEMTRQTLEFLGEKPVLGGCLEIGTTGRYIVALKKKARVKGPIYLMNDQAPSYGVSDIVDRGKLPKVGTFLDMKDYGVFGADRIPDGSLDLVSNFIGFHHCPADNLEGFVASIRRVLKPGGRLLLRDHDCDGRDQTTLVALAHDVFNAGVGLSWKDNHGQIRLFRPIRGWSEYLTARGFQRSERTLAQRGDPTKNLLLEFKRT